MSETTKHTPGPWTAEPMEDGCSVAYRINDANGYEIAVTSGRDSEGEEESNACVIAAAPNMLAELKRDLQFAREMKGLIEALKGKKWVQHTMVLNRIERLTAAIVRAEGR